MRKPKTIDGQIKAITRAANKLGYTIRKIWYCNAGWGIAYIRYKDDEPSTHCYYDSIKGCVGGEYRRVVEKKKERGGFYLK